MAAVAPPSRAIPAAVPEPLPAPAAGTRAPPAWLQALPLALVFLVFFVAAAGAHAVVSFWDYNEYEIIPAFTSQNYVEHLRRLLRRQSMRPTGDMCVTFKTYLSTLKFCAARVAASRSFSASRSPISSPSMCARGHADAAVPDLHDPVLDLERDPHDLVGSAARAQRARQPGLSRRRHHRHADRVAAVLRLLGGARLRASLHALHDRADLQLDDAHRPRAASKRRAMPAHPAGRPCGT